MRDVEVWYEIEYRPVGDEAWLDMNTWSNRPLTYAAAKKIAHGLSPAIDHRIVEVTATRKVMKETNA